MGTDPVRQTLRPGGLRIGIIGRTQHSNEYLGGVKLSGCSINDGNRLPGIVNEQLLTRAVILTHHYVQFALPLPILLAEPTVLIAFCMCLPAFLPQQKQGHTFSFEIQLNLGPVGNPTLLCGQVRRWWEQQPFQAGVIQFLRYRPIQACVSGPTQIFTDCWPSNTACRSDLTIAQLPV